MKPRRFFWQVFLSFLALSVISVLLFIFFESFMKKPYLSALMAALPIIAVSAMLSIRVSRPIRRLNDRVQKMAEGQLEFANEPEKVLAGIEADEIKELAHHIDTISAQMHKRLRTILQQKNEQEAVFSSMAEGVIAIDQNSRILHFNRAAGLILGISQNHGKGFEVKQVIDAPEIIELVDETLKKGEPLEKDIELPEGPMRFLQVHSSPLRQEDHMNFGVVLVLSDVTRIRELEGMRRNFVANVSHELRTPLTSIQGFAETLLNPAVKDTNEIRKFVEIIQKHAFRLSRIIEDILTLSRIEKDAEAHQIDLKEDAIFKTVQSAVELCHMKAARKNIALTFKCQTEARAMINPDLLEQAIVNLIDNAIRYSDEGLSVDVVVREESKEIIIDVIDKGMGIPEKQISRIFERFYRVDKARSRELGGTGLGLSIVKHISIAHRGRVEVKSVVGKGSTFSIHLPKL